MMIWNEDKYNIDDPVGPPPPPPADDPDPTPPPSDVMWEAQDGKVVMQAEKGVPTSENNAGNTDWVISDDLSGHTGDGYLIWDGPNLYTKPGSGALAYEVSISEGGEFKLGLVGSRP